MNRFLMFLQVEWVYTVHMKTLLAILLTLTLSTSVFAQEMVTLGVCLYPDGVYQFSIDGNVDGWGFTGGAAHDLNAKTATGDGVAFFVWFGGTIETIYGFPDAPPCPTDDNWQPGAPSIPLPLTSDCAFVDIQDAYGNWHHVESEGTPVLLHYGQALIGSNTQSVNSDDYRVIATPCF